MTLIKSKYFFVCGALWRLARGSTEGQITGRLTTRATDVDIEGEEEKETSKDHTKLRDVSSSNSGRKYHRDSALKGRIAEILWKNSLRLIEPSSL